MKLFFFAAAVFALSQVSGLAAVLPRDVQGRNAEVLLDYSAVPNLPLTLSQSPCGDPNTAVNLLRAFSSSASDHFYTTNVDEMGNAVQHLGYSLEGTAAKVFASQAVSTVPLFRLYSSGATDHFYTTSASERDSAVLNSGYTDEGIAAYVYNIQVCGSIPFYRLYKGGAGADHFYTTSASEASSAVANSGYSLEGIAAYVLSA